MDIRNVLLIGGSGFVGGAIANRLSEQGIRVTIPTRRRDNTKGLILLPTIEMVEADVNDPQALAALMAGQDAVINLVGILHDADSRLPYGKGFAAAHVNLPKKIVAAMQQAGIRRLLHMSALGAAVYGTSEYQRSKGEGEAAVRAAGAAGTLDVTVFRPSVIFGPGDAFLNMFARFLRLLPVFPLGGGNARFQPVHVGDVADAFVDALGKRATYGQCYDLCGPKVYTLRQLVEYTGEVCGHPRPVVNLPEGLAYLQAGLLWLLPKPPMSPDNLRSMEVDNVTDGSHDYPGWSPTPLEAVAPTYLADLKPKRRLDAFRFRAGR